MQNQVPGDSWSILSDKRSNRLVYFIENEGVVPYLLAGMQTHIMTSPIIITFESKVFKSGQCGTNISINLPAPCCARKLTDAYLSHLASFIHSLSWTNMTFYEQKFFTHI